MGKKYIDYDPDIGLIIRSGAKLKHLALFFEGRDLETIEDMLEKSPLILANGRNISEGYRNGSTLDFFIYFAVGNKNVGEFDRDDELSFG